jgi:hypothetical protein
VNGVYRFRGQERDIQLGLCEPCREPRYLCAVSLCCRHPLCDDIGGLAVEVSGEEVTDDSKVALGGLWNQTAIQLDVVCTRELMGMCRGVSGGLVQKNNECAYNSSICAWRHFYS